MKHAVIALKPGIEPTPLLDLARSVLTDDARIRLVSFVQISTNEDEVQRLDETRRYVERIAGGLREQGHPVDIEVSVAATGIGHTIADIAERVDADLLVLGLTKRSLVGKILLGSNAQGALMAAPCPVLCVHI
jgi:nucleotide-binding universal stress UspA family protein